MEQCGGTLLVEQWNSESGTVMLEKCRRNSDGRTVTGNSGRVLVEHWNSDGGTLWWNSGKVLVKHS